MTEGSSALVYIDANPLMYAFESGLENAKPIMALIEALKLRPGAGVTSEITLGELLAPVRRPGSLLAPHKRRIYMNLLVLNRWFDLRPVTQHVILESATLRERANLKLVDAIHLATALSAGCRYILSSDRDMERGPGQIRRVEPDAQGIEALLREVA